jgi:hypothetical protein
VTKIKRTPSLVSPVIPIILFASFHCDVTKFILRSLYNLMQFATSDVLDGVGLEAVEQLKLVKRHKRLYITSTKAGTSSPDGNSIRCSVLREELHFIAVHAKKGKSVEEFFEFIKWWFCGFKKH